MQLCNSLPSQLVEGAGDSTYMGYFVATQKSQFLHILIRLHSECPSYKCRSNLSSRSNFTQTGQRPGRIRDILLAFNKHALSSEVYYSRSITLNIPGFFFSTQLLKS